MNTDPTDWENLEKNIDILSAIAPLVRQVEVQAATPNMAIGKLLERLNVTTGNDDDTSKTRQAYKLRSM